VFVTWQSHQGLRQQQQINFAEETVLTRFTTRVIIDLRKTVLTRFTTRVIIDLRNSALVPFEVTANYFIFLIPASDTDFQNTGLC